MTAPDLRLHALDETRRVAERALAGQVGSDWTLLTPTPGWAGAGRVSLRARPEERAPQVTEALLGEALDIIEQREDGWAWVRTRHDRYLGYARITDLQAQAPHQAVQVRAPRAHLFAGTHVSTALLDTVGYGARPGRLAPEPVQAGKYLWWPVAYRGSEAYLHDAALNEPGDAEDHFQFLRRYLDAPYVWGGRSAWGLDCSGLTQLWYARRFGQGALPRDADQQRDVLTPVDAPQPGDLAFFPGHVGVMLDERRMLHANATHMRVSVDTLGEGPYGQALQADLLGFGRWSGTPFTVC